MDWEEGEESGRSNIVLSSSLLTASNPYFIVWWVVAGMGLMTAAHQLFGLPGVLVFYLGHLSADAAWYLFVSSLMGRTRGFLRPGLYRRIVAFLGLCLLGFGINLLMKL